MALSVAGYWEEAEQAYFWLIEQQLTNGSWYAHYFSDDEQSHLIETNFVAYIATGALHHFLISKNKDFLRKLYPAIARAINFVLRYQSSEGEIFWAVDHQDIAQEDALVTACSSIYRSLICALKISHILQIQQPHWSVACVDLENALLNKPHRFDRTWPSKQRFAMDWYYPVLCGLHQGQQAKDIITQRWSEFVVEGLGCKCVSDEPWVTMAETSELVMALANIGERNAATELFNTLQQWQDEDGGFWTGYVYRDKTLWPEEKTTWTAAAVILAFDCLQQMTGAHGIFHLPNPLKI